VLLLCWEYLSGGRRRWLLAPPGSLQQIPRPEVSDSIATTASTITCNDQPSATSNSKVIEFTPAPLDELAEQRRERQERAELMNIQLRFPAAYAGKYAVFQQSEFYVSAVESFETGETASDWAWFQMTRI
jgi:hypothetical protein